MDDSSQEQRVLELETRMSHLELKLNQFLGLATAALAIAVMTWFFR